MELQVGVKAFLKNKDGKFLLLKRARNHGTTGEWDIPGGRINPETPLGENLKREIQEETGLTLSAKPLLIAAQDIIKPGFHVVRLTYQGIIDGTPKLSEEHSEYQWMTLEELTRLSPLDSYIKELLDKKLVH